MKQKLTKHTNKKHNTTMGNWHEVHALVMRKFRMKADYISIVIVYDENYSAIARIWYARLQIAAARFFVYLRSREKVFSF